MVSHISLKIFGFGTENVKHNVSKEKPDTFECCLNFVVSD